jgi:hypothetical protein
MRNHVFDIDGTLSLVGARAECLRRSPKAWDEFYARCGEDLPNEPVLRLLRVLLYCPAHSVTLLTGRRESCRQATTDWLHRQGVYHLLPAELLMRPDNDWRPDTIVKPELLAQAGIVPDIVYEDRDSMVEYWRAQGVCCMQVARGAF